MGRELEEAQDWIFYHQSSAEEAARRAGLLAEYVNELRDEISVLRDTNALQAHLVEAQIHILKVHGILEGCDG